MKTKFRTKRRFLATVLCLPLLFLLAGCDTGGVGVVYEITPETDFRVDCFRPEGATQMLFTATGAIEDKGTIEGGPLPVDQGKDTWRGYRMLQGRNGVVVLYVEARFVSYGSTVADGRFTILESSEAYGDLKGDGVFRATFTEEEGLVEIFEGNLVAF